MSQQMTWRAPEELLARVKLAARQRGRSLNEYVTAVLEVATDPSLAGSEAEQLHARLEQAGLAGPVGPPRQRPPAELVAKARSAAGTGVSLSSLVALGR